LRSALHPGEDVRRISHRGAEAGPLNVVCALHILDTVDQIG
jgi:hypothetical protein